MAKGSKSTPTRRAPSSSSPVPVPTIHSPAPAPTQGHNRSSSTWSPQSDGTLMAARAQGLNWQPIASTYFPHKTPNACRKRHERLMERRHNESWDGEKLEQLATGYVECRGQMWTVLGKRLGEKWEIVEAKCMEKGFKNLRSIAAGAARRRSRAGTDDHTDDSGVGLDAETERDGGDDRLRVRAGAQVGAGPGAGHQVSAQRHVSDHYTADSQPRYAVQSTYMSVQQVAQPQMSAYHPDSSEHQHLQPTHRRYGSGPSIASLLSPMVPSP